MNAREAKRGEFGMEEQLHLFVKYLGEKRNMANNTILSYERDLRQMNDWLFGLGIFESSKVNETVLYSYILWMEKKGKASTTVSRVIASMKAFFAFEQQRGVIERNPAERLKAPRLEKRMPVVLSGNEVEAFLQSARGKSAKKMRDSAMLELLCETGLRASEMIALKCSDINLEIGYVNCVKSGERARAVPFGMRTKAALSDYLFQGREQFLKGRQSDFLFVNTSGNAMSRQGFWKIIKHYGERAGIRKDITPQALRNSFAVNLVKSGVDLRSVQTMLGHSDPAVTHAYVSGMHAGIRR